MGKVTLHRKGVVPGIGQRMTLRPTGLAPFSIELGEGWTQEGVRAFVWEGPTVATSPQLALKGVEAGAAYNIALNVTEITGTSPILHVRLGGPPGLGGIGITAPGAYNYEKVIANDGDALEFIIDTAANADRVVLKSLHINRVD